MQDRTGLEQQPSLGSALLKNIASAVSGRLAGAVLGVVTLAVLARTIGADGLGQYRTVLTLLLFAGIAFDFGLYSVTLREMSRPGADQPRLLANAATLRVLGTLCGVILLAVGLIATEFDSAVRYGVLIVGVGWIGQQLNEFLRAVFQLHLVQHRGVLAEVAGAVLTLALVLALATTGAGVASMLVATSLGFLCTAALTLSYANRLVRLRVRIEWPVWRTLLIAGVPIAASVILVNVQLRADILLLALLRSPREVGLYDVPFKLYELLYVVPALFGGLLMPLFVRDHAGGRASIAPRLNAALGAHVVLALVACAALYMCAEPLVTLIAGAEFAPSAQPLRILALAAVFVGVTAILRFAAISLELQKSSLRADAIGACAAVLAHAVLIPRYGIIGAALGKLCGDLVTCGAAATVLRQHLHVTALIKVAVGIAAGAIVAGGMKFASDQGLSMLLACAICVPLGLGAVLLLPAIRRDLVALSVSHVQQRGSK
jgi:O-antigen/teichoic acid export membrane protein